MASSAQKQLQSCFSALGGLYSTIDGIVDFFVLPEVHKDYETLVQAFIVFTQLGCKVECCIESSQGQETIDHR